VEGLIDGLSATLPGLMERREKMLRLPCDGASACRFEKDLMDRLEDRCLPAGTKVLTVHDDVWTARGTVKEGPPNTIDKLKVGDWIISYDEKTGKKVPDKVIDCSERMTYNDLLFLEFSNGNEFEITENHPIYVINKGWVRADELSVGDEVIQYSYNGLSLRLRNLRENRTETNRERFRKLAKEGGKEWQQRPTLARSGETFNKIGDSVKARWDDENNIFNSEMDLERRKKQLMSVAPSSEDKSISLKKLWDDPNSWFNSDQAKKLRSGHMSKMLDEWWSEGGILRTKEHSEKVSENARRMWSNPKMKEKMVKSMFKAVSSTPNSTENYLLELIEEWLPTEYEYNDSQLIGGRKPDFISTNGKKKIIELFGCYWHNCPYHTRADREMEINEDFDKLVKDIENERKEHFAKFGYDTLIIWEHDLHIEDLFSSLEQKVKSFTFNDNVEVVEVSSVQKATRQYIKVYDIETENNHNFFAYGILVHNSNPLCPIMIDQFCPKAHDMTALVDEMIVRYPNYIEDCNAYVDRVGRHLNSVLFD